MHLLLTQANLIDTFEQDFFEIKKFPCWISVSLFFFFCIQWGLLVMFQSKNSLRVDSQQSSQPAFTCWKLAIETVEQGVKYVQS